MPRRFAVAFVLVLFIIGLFALLWFSQNQDEEGESRDPSGRPNEWFWHQRAYPHGDIRLSSVRLALEQAAALRAAERGTRVAWQPEGPGNIGARVTDVAVHPTDPDIVYAAMASGGVFKSTDAGESWTPTFDEQAVLSVGAVAIDPTNPDLIWAGTGEANAGSFSFFGLGIYRSTDAGASWEPRGLEETRYIARIVVDPHNGQRVFAAATGRLFGTGPHRGIYRTSDGGESWERVLALTDSTAAIDLVMNPTDPDILYAAMWERSRGLNYRNSGGPSSGVWRSTDGGESWNELINGLPTGSDVGRIGLTLCTSQPEVLYAIYADATGYFEGVYKSTDGGDSWSGTNDGALGNLYSSYGWWFGNIRVDPSDPDNVLALGLPCYRSTNGGASWSETGPNMHVDHHGMAFAPSRPTRVYDGNDGGVYRSEDSGATWTKLYDQPSSQFYAIAIDPLNPHRLYGGTQDNGTLRTWNGGTDDWEMILGGDGFYCIVDPTNSNTIYAEYQYGNLYKSTNGGYGWSDATDGISYGDRRNWSTPVVMDPNFEPILYYGTFRLYRSANAAGSWSPISGDLTGGNQGGNYGTITTIDVAHTDPDVIYVGTDDGRVWVTSNAGDDWTRISDDLPDRWITRVETDPSDAAIVYVTVSGFRWDSPAPHVFRSDDMGANWTDISGNLPEAPANVIVCDPDYPNVLYVGTDIGCFVSATTGESWSALGTGLPAAPVLDLKLHAPTRTLVAGTHGRSMFSLDVSDLVSLVPNAPAAADLRPALRLAPRRNPFAEETTLRYELERSAGVRLSIHDVSGRELIVLVDGRQSAGPHEVRWRARDRNGRSVPPGVYFARIAADGRTAERKLVVLE
ncbi:MAG: T9SS type A sorting domain-containing protein [Candidatus Eisenbacteria bacterium]|nr:T9SS type A sorting domain-containing protein [Candidatus Eisenbacteria bacterium]